MAGGVGSRFWPQSRNDNPKQFIDILGVGKSLFQLTYERFLRICPAENIFILTNAQYKDLVLQQIVGLQPANLLLEPSRNNTAPCIAYACYKIQQLNAAANIVVAPSDHLILKEDEFIGRVETALSYSAGHEALLTLGIQPTRPDTGYGYINFEKDHRDGIHAVKRFMEKPVLEKAKEFVASGDYLWNAGIFIWSAAAITMAFEKFAPALHQLFSKGIPFYNTPREQEFINEHYPQSQNISIDYAIMEKADNVFTLPADIGWSDLGTWASLYAVSSKDEHNNVVNEGRTILKETSQCMIHLPKNKLAVIKGLNNYIVVDDGAVLLIYPKEQEQEIKQVSQEVEARFGKEFL